MFGPFSFTILKIGTEPGWRLTAELPGLGRKNADSDNPDDLKAAAERWLEEFVSSLDASFEPDARWSALKDYLTKQVTNLEVLGHHLPDRDQLALACTIGAARLTLAKMQDLESATRQEHTGDGEPR